MGNNGNLSKAELFIQNLNANNAKKLAFAMVLGFVVYHAFLHLRYGKRRLCAETICPEA